MSKSMFSEYMYASFSDAYYDGDKIWFSNHTFNGLFTYNILEKEVLFHGIFPGFDEYEKLMHKKVVKYKNDLVFFPNKEFVGVHIYSDTTREIVFCDNGIEQISKSESIADFVVLESKCLIFFKNVAAGIYEYDFETRTFCAKQDFFADIMVENLITSDDSILRLYHQDNVIWIPINSKNYIIKYKLIEKVFEVIKLTEDVRIADIAFNNDEIIITQINNCEVLKGKIGELKRYQLAKVNLKEELMPPNDKWAVYSRIINVGQEIILLPRCAKELLKINSEDKCIVPIKQDNERYEILSTRKNWPAYYGFVKEEDELFLCPCATNFAIRMNYNLQNIIYEKIKLDEVDYTQKVVAGLKEKRIKKWIDNKVVVKESNDLATVHDFIRVIKSI